MEKVSLITSSFQSLKHSVLLPYAFCLALIIGPAYNMYVHYDFSHSIDTESYLAMSDGNFSVNPVHRYRFIVPLLAKIIAIPLKLIYTKLWPHRAESLWPLQLAYFIVNSLLTAFYGWIVYRILRLYSDQLIAVLVGLTAILTSRWVSYIGGLPLTDSLYLVIIVALLYSIKNRNTMLFIFIVLFGSVAKESFLLFTPLILIAGPLNWIKRFLLITGALIILLGEHVIIDHIYPLDVTAVSIKHENLLKILIRHAAEIKTTVIDLLSIRGLGELFTVLGIFSFIILYAFTQTDYRKYLKSTIEKYYWVFFACIILHAFLSGDAARMFYFGSALYAVLIVMITEKAINKKG